MNQRMVFCQKLQKEAPGLTRVPYPGPLGQRIFESICMEAWQQWLQQQTLLINENRLNVLDPKSRSFLENEMQKFLFEGADEKPAGFKPIE
ncbi:MAG: oxidative damage protection protein [Gammaproteobacteria bacterium 39-13]|nr:oxidative damage protection protein [Gammaproteobacteria bacterium]OJV90525.1 MAG: oxidative damage protection protein [Gammaproteobacteria bacterium 39-13]